MDVGDELQINELGDLSQNDLNDGQWEVARRFTGRPEESRYASKDWRWRISRITNDHGQLLRDQLRISRRSQLRNGSSEYAQVNVNSSGVDDLLTRGRSEEHTSELQSLMRISYAVFCLKKKKIYKTFNTHTTKLV